MFDPHLEARILLLEALRREGIDCPPDRVEASVEDFAHLLGFVSEIRTALSRSEESRDDV